MNKPLVTVMVPLYNHARFIETCLDSIKDDPWPNKEVVIIDDGSSDGSTDVVRKWHERQGSSPFTRFELITRPNKGLTRTINELIANSRGDYLVLIASDDYLLPGGIGARLEYLQSHPEKLAVFSDCTVVDDAGATIHDSGIRDLWGGRVELLANPEVMDLELIFNWCVPGPVFMAHRELYEKVGLYNEDLLVEDWDMYIRICAQGLLGFVPGQVAAYRYHSENTVTNVEKTIAVNKCHIKSAWKHAWAFTGIRRYGLLYKHYKIRETIAGQEGRRFAGLYAEKMSKLLRRLSIKPYRRLVATLICPDSV